MRKCTLVLISILGPAALLNGQTPPSGRGFKVDLASPSLTLFNSGPRPLAESMSGARSAAGSLGITWTGLDVIVFDGLPAVQPNEPSISVKYQQRVCRADVVAVGHIQASASHLSTYRTGVYTDYDFVIDRLLKDNQAAPIGSALNFVVTRLGGSVKLPEGNLNFRSREFPSLQANTTYHMFLDYIPATSSYFARDGLSTLRLVGSNWMIDSESNAGVIVPGFTLATLEPSLTDWLGYCKK
jgi:hypothetical protein